MLPLRDMPALLNRLRALDDLCKHQERAEQPSPDPTPELDEPE